MDISLIIMSLYIHSWMGEKEFITQGALQLVSFLIAAILRWSLSFLHWFVEFFFGSPAKQSHVRTQLKGNILNDCRLKALFFLGYRVASNFGCLKATVNIS